MWDELLPYAEEKNIDRTQIEEDTDSKNKKSIHDEIKEKLVVIGELLGFESKSEVKISSGAVVAVADEEQLAKIIRESKSVIDETSLRTWELEDVLAVYESLVRVHESINKLALVPESF